MQFKLSEKEREVLEKLDWRLVDITNDDRMAYVEIENWSPAGENLCETITVDEWDSFPTAVRKWAQSFNKDEHVELWAGSRGKNGVPFTIRELVEDAEAIQAMFYDLADAIEALYDELEDDDSYVKVYRVPLLWQMYGSVLVEATNEDEATYKAMRSLNVSLPEGKYVEDTAEIDDCIDIEVTRVLSKKADE